MILTREDPKAEEFLERLQGPEGCDFKEGETVEKTTWKCGGNRSLADKILADMGYENIACPDRYCCSCEIVFNWD